MPHHHGPRVGLQRPLRAGFGAVVEPHPPPVPAGLHEERRGALVGSFIIGIFIEVSTLFVPAELKFVGALLVLILVLLFRPQGLLGRAERVG